MSSERSIETVGETVEEAISKGLSELGVASNEVIVEVLDEPSRGVFGIGARPARVRLQLIVVRREPAPPPPPLVPMPVYDDADDDDDGFSDLSVATDEDAEVGRVVLMEILDKLAIRAEVKISRSDSSQSEESVPWLLNVVGEDDLTPLIGRRGETLASLQYITRLITSRELQRRANIVVDVDNYKSRRTTKLYELAARMADQAVAQNHTVSLEPMPPYERRIIHMALRNRTDVLTKSVGEGDARKVTIVPA